MRTDATQIPPPLTDEQQAKFDKAVNKFFRQYVRAIQSQLHGEVLARIPFHGLKGAGREVAEYRETFVE